MAQYLPVLLVSVSAVSSANTAPDDSSLDTQAIGQVDYLSHDWQEEDVAKSWRNMTRRKDSIQNGARLENASWRTWWKQRNNLPTVSPETLNWLKDSDVTWLYGPLHTAADWAPPPPHTPSPEYDTLKSFPTSPSVGSSTLQPNDTRPHSQSPRSNSPWALKPILKHRSISELLSISFPSSPASDFMELGEVQGLFDADATGATSRTRVSREMNDLPESRKRPKLTHTKSDTNVHRRNPFRGDSPPLPLSPGAHDHAPSVSPLRSTTRSRDSSCGDNTNGQKRHISFNTFVEQCIAIEKPDQSSDGFYDVAEEDEDAFEVNEEMHRYGEDDEESDNDAYESEDDVLEMRPSSHFRPNGRRTPSLSGTSNSSASGYAGFDMSSTGSEREHVTIAPIAPTMLKTSASPSPVGALYHGGYGGAWEDEDEDEEETLFISRRPYSTGIDTATDAVNLVYVPPQGSVYAEMMSESGTAINGHLVGTGAKGSLRGSPPKVTPELRATSFDDASVLPARRRHDIDLVPPFDSGFDFFGGPDMGGIEDVSYRSSARPRTGRSPGQLRSASTSDLGTRDPSELEEAHMEEAQSTRSRGSSGSVSEEGTVIPPSLPVPSSPMVQLPDNVASSPVAVSFPAVPQSPSAAIPVPRQPGHVHQLPSPAASSTTSSTTTSNSSGTGAGGSYGSPFLEPPARGRSISPVTSASLSGDGGRGRSSSRRGSSISLSDLERSGRDKEEREPQRGRSRSRSIGTGSPLDGSVSPRAGSHCRLGRRASIDGGSIGLGGLGSAYGLPASPTWRDQSLSPEDADGTRKGGRMRSRVKRSGKGGESSVSPPSVTQEKEIVAADESPAMVRVPAIRNSLETSPPVLVEHYRSDDADVTSYGLPVSSPNAKSVRGPAAIQVGNPAPAHNRSFSEESPTLVGRAVSSAKGYLGSFWGNGERHVQYMRESPSASSALGPL